MSTNRETIAESLKGHLLVASPYADGTPYRRAAVLLFEHSEQGATGVVVDGMLRASVEQLRVQSPRRAGLAGDEPVRLAGVPVRVAKWDGGQLDLELQQGIWLHTPVGPGFVFRDPVPRWSEIVRYVGRTVYRDALGIAGFPADPALN